jgi:hypothetical protein
MAQFVVLPPLSRIRIFFEAATSAKFVPEAAWHSWKPVSTDDIAWLRDYIRPSHQKILNETMDGIQDSPCSLLRQILRPHDYRIERESYGWTLKHGPRPASPTKLSVRTGVVSWEETNQT